jgi:uncharacterized membrane protein
MKQFINIFNTNKNYNISITYFVSYCICLLLLRVKLTQSIYMLFLVWNLFLAAIPYVILLAARNYTSFKSIGFKLSLSLIIWLLFLPNSFYIVTDLVHLTKSDQSTIWLDIIILSSFTITGFALGILSILEFEKIIKQSLTTKITNMIVPAICFLCGFGIYLGRVLRYNSWDIISNPMQLSIDIGIKLTSKDSLIFSVLFGFFIYSVYFVFKNTTKKSIIKINSAKDERDT